MAKRTNDIYTRKWIIENSVEILSRYEPGVLTISINDKGVALSVSKYWHDKHVAAL
jgi:hypothetical protein